jgi:hypothetical protein
MSKFVHQEMLKYKEIITNGVLELLLRPRYNVE